LQLRDLFDEDFVKVIEKILWAALEENEA